MLGTGDRVTLFGRFRASSRDDLERSLVAAGAETVKDLTRTTTLLVVGAGATNLIANGRLPARLSVARDRGTPVLGERRLLRRLEGHLERAPDVPVARVAAIPIPLADLLAAFDLIALTDDRIAFQDADTVRNAVALHDRGVPPEEIVGALLRRSAAPRGRHRLTTDPHGTALLQWDDGVTTLEGQGLLPLEQSDSLDTVFEAALEAEEAGDLEAAARAYAICTRADRRDPIAPYNLGNVECARGRLDAAALAYRIAIARDPHFAEAHFNLAGTLDRMGDAPGALAHLERATAIDDAYPDALFNLAQARLDTAPEVAGDLYRRVLAVAPGTALARKSRKALDFLHMASRT